MTALPVFFTKTADAAVRQASEWWRNNRPAAPNAIAEELDRALALIAVQPGIGARARNISLQGVRRVHLSRIHYYLYYRVPSGKQVEVLAFWHTSRGSEPSIALDR